MTSTVPPLAQVAAKESFTGLLAAIAALGHAAWIVDAAQGHILAANVDAEELLERKDLEGLDADDAIPDLEDMAYWEIGRASCRERVLLSV